MDGIDAALKWVDENDWTGASGLAGDLAPVFAENERLRAEVAHWKAAAYTEADGVTCAFRGPAEDMTTKILATLALHYTERKHDVEVCAECGSLWPCPTVKSLKGKKE